MKKSIRAIVNITFSSVKMYFRDKQAIFWSLFLPVMIMSIFGVMKFDQIGKVSLGIVDFAKNQNSEKLIENLKEIEALNITEGKIDVEKEALEKGERDMVLILPKEFGGNQTQPEQTLSPTIPSQSQQKSPSLEPLNIELYYNEGKRDEVQIGTTVLSETFDRYTHAITKTPDLFILDKKPISSRNLTYVDFLIPGILAMSIMQMGVVGVAASIVTWRERGILRRLLATPVHSSAVIFSQVVTRLIISILQSVTIIVLGVVIFHINLVGSFLLIFLLAVLGGIIFLSIGFALSGFGESHNTVMALANVIMMPMMFLSGVFFPREALPALLQDITQYLPLTYLANGMRNVMIEGYSIIQIKTEMIGLLIWVVISFILATKFFRWE